ncbi:methyltransferase domain-containing protein [Natronorarus salvus]|uniref:methyltransferase domain-containing protein n=1 Tax=Natronorarus salvus TaxID=3117733 RepID=UPI002F26CA27
MYVLELAGEDDAFAAYEAASAATGVEVAAPGVATAREVTDRVRTLAYTHRVSELIGECSASVESARETLESATIEREGSVAVRARDVRGATGVSTGATERDLGSVLVGRGFSVDLDDPDHELRAAFAGESCFLGWLVAESERGFGGRAPAKKPYFQPGSMDPLNARAIVNVAGSRPGRTVVDPMCGTGGVLVEAGLVGARVVGSDVQWKMVRGASENLDRYLPPDRWSVVRGDATALPIGENAVDTVVFDAPYGRQSKVAGHGLAALVGGALREARRIAPRAVVVTDRRWDEAAEDAGWAVEAVFDRRVHRSLTRYVHVLREPEGE